MSTQTGSDLRYGRRGSHVAAALPTVCCRPACRQQAGPTRLFCSDVCALEAQREVWAARHPRDPLPARLATMDAYLAWRAS